MTERLYFADSHLLEFDACVVEITNHAGQPAAVLDRTAFYPTGGGQPNDAGTIGTSTVIDVVEVDDDRILHVPGVAEGLDAGATVSCRVDAARRRDHLQQHTGQHVLSQAFVRLFGGETRGFRMGAEVCEIDVDLADATPAMVDEAEALANRIVFDDRPVRVHFVDKEDAAALPLRKDSDREGCLRVIEIADYDWSPCGGTHAHRTGEIGLIAIRGVERAKRMLRVEFVCGVRALADYRRANRTALESALLFSRGRDEGPDAIRRLMDETKGLRRRVKELSEIASEVEGRRLFAEGEERGAFRLVARRLDGRSADELLLLANKVVAEGPAVALLASDEGGAARLVFARSEGLAVDCGRLMRAACDEIGGRGGGKPDLARGGGPESARLDAALRAAEDVLSAEC